MCFTATSQQVKYISKYNWVFHLKTNFTSETFFNIAVPIPFPILEKISYKYIQLQEQQQSQWQWQ